MNALQTDCVRSSRRGAECPQGTVSSRMTAVSSRVHTCPAVWQVKPVEPPEQTDVWLVNRNERWKGGSSVSDMVTGELVPRGSRTPGCLVRAGLWGQRDAELLPLKSLNVRKRAKKGHTDIQLLE